MKDAVWNPKPAVELKHNIRAEIERKVEEFLANGGEITEVPINARAEPTAYGRIGLSEQSE